MHKAIAFCNATKLRKKTQYSTLQKRLMTMCTRNDPRAKKSCRDTHAIASWCTLNSLTQLCPDLGDAPKQFHREHDGPSSRSIHGQV